MSEESVSLCFLVTFNIIINYIFTKKFIEIHLSLRRYISYKKKLTTLASIRQFQQFFDLEF